MDNREAIKVLKRDLQIQKHNKALPDGIEALEIAIQAIEELEEYRELGTVEETKQFMSEVHRLMDSEKMLVDYIKLGTLEQVREAVEFYNNNREEKEY